MKLQNFNSEPQNIEYRTAECRRMESLRSVFLNMPEYIIRRWTFGCSMLDVRQFLFRSNWPLFRPAAALNPDWVEAKSHQR